MGPDRLAALLEPWLSGGGAAYVALSRGVRGLVLDGRLPHGARLPSERSLAATLGVSRTTVSAAYDLLRAEGYLRSAHGAGSSISIPSARVQRPDSVAGEPADVLDLTVAALPAPSQLLDAVTAASADLSSQLAGHGLHPFGLPSLRAAVARHLTGRGLPTEPEQVLVTSGALQGWNLVVRAVCRPGQPVLVEQPTYPAVLDALRAHHVRPVPLPVTAAGWDRPPAGMSAAHLTPDGQNPTGLVAGEDARRRVLADLRDAVVAVDETFADLVLDGPAPLPAAVLRHDVVTLGSMNKAFWAGLRIGWMRADPALLNRLAHERASVDLGSPVLDQLVAVRLLDDADAILSERRDLLRRSRAALEEALRARVPDWRWTSPRAGMALWIELPRPSATRLAASALDLGLRITAGPRFAVDGTADRWLRVPFTLPAGQAEVVADLLREAWERSSAPSTRDPRVSGWTA
ncbi:MocR-like transcription factor YczR [Lentzea cavernae]|uniref:GntR family transcriptional regulator n=1 Tax=Lentzea cavernae TaxID=2020703 RepID=A0ABQ3M689_9PSEU|nr:PLP-dependent aminotransferase family protein [Lentzea cavernae]GHH27966.1 GntR family transcriptional regulator [Lentzea cavernae]